MNPLPGHRADMTAAAVALSAPAPELPKHHKAIESTKTFGHEVGFSCAFRQWRAYSHCRFIHGYALGFKFTFAANQVDSCGWVVDFGGLKGLKEILADTFDHKLLVAEDDPAIHHIKMLAGDQMRYAPNFDDDKRIPPAADVVVVPATGCEAFARMVFEVTEQWLKDAGFSPRCWLVSVEVSEHGANSVICYG